MRCGYELAAKLLKDAGWDDDMVQRNPEELEQLAMQHAKLQEQDTIDWIARNLEANEFATVPL